MFHKQIRRPFARKNREMLLRNYSTSVEGIITHGPIGNHHGSVNPAKRKEFQTIADSVYRGMYVEVTQPDMTGVEEKRMLGIVTDEDAMFDLLVKFLSKEGYEVKRVVHEIGEEEDLALIIHAPTRFSERSKKFFKSSKKKKLLIVQSVDEDNSEFGDDAVILSERPLNLKQLSDTIKRVLANSSYVGTDR